MLNFAPRKTLNSKYLMSKCITTTSRLILRELSVKDAESFFLLNQNPNVIRYTGDSAFTSLEAAEQFLQNYSDYQRNGMGRWAVVLKESNEFIGWCGLKLHSDQTVDIGFRFFEQQWGKGYATESAQAAFQYGFEQLHLREIIGRAARENLASVRVLEKLNMQYWKTDSCDGIEDCVYYRITDAQFSESERIKNAKRSN